MDAIKPTDHTLPFEPNEWQGPVATGRREAEFSITLATIARQPEEEGSPPLPENLIWWKQSQFGKVFICVWANDFVLALSTVSHFSTYVG